MSEILLRAVADAVRDHLAESYGGRLAELESLKGTLTHPVTLNPQVVVPAAEVRNEVHPSPVSVTNEVPVPSVSVTNEVAAPVVNVTNAVAVPSVHVTNDVPAPDVYVDLSLMAAAVEKLGEGLTALAGAFGQLAEGSRQQTALLERLVAAEERRARRVVKFRHDRDGNPVEATVQDQ